MSMCLRISRYHKRGKRERQRCGTERDHLLLCIPSASWVGLVWPWLGLLDLEMPCFFKKLFATSGQRQGVWRDTVSRGSCSSAVSKSHKQGKELLSFQSEFEGFKSPMQHLLLVDVRDGPSHGVHDAAHGGSRVQKNHFLQLLVLSVAPLSSPPAGCCRFCP